LNEAGLLGAFIFLWVLDLQSAWIVSMLVSLLQT
jgi:hypothetical protein